jgi:glucose/arabinose dehydrogenase
MSNRLVLILSVCVVFLIVLGVIGFGNRDHIEENNTRSEPLQEEEIREIQTVASNLSIPWDFVFLPDGDMLITERRGVLRRIGNVEQEIPIEGVAHIGEGGLLGITLHPEFTINRYVYMYLTYQGQGRIQNRVLRYVYTEEGNLQEQTIILSEIPGGTTHNGGRLAFGPDGYLYVTTGDAGVPRLSQEVDSLAGKILRIDENGAIPAENPFGNAVYSYGHRNPQGLAWDDFGRLWSTEHGARAQDEVNRIEIGNNYGWPTIQGDETRDGMESPYVQSGSATWAPSGIMIIDSTLYFVGLRGGSVFRLFLEDESRSVRSLYETEFGRLRAIQEHDGYVYIATNNTDGRGSPRDGDDRIIRVPLEFVK